MADHFVRVLLERKEDVEAETFLRPCALLGRAHDAVARAGDGHVTGLGDEPGELGRAGVARRRRTGAGRAEDTDFPDAPVGREDLLSVAQFGHGPLEEDHVARGDVLLGKLVERGDHFGEVVGEFGDFPLGDEMLDFPR